MKTAQLLLFTAAGTKIYMKNREKFRNVMGFLFTREVHKEVARRHSSEVNKAIGACGVELQYSHEKPHNRHRN